MREDYTRWNGAIKASPWETKTDGVKCDIFFRKAIC